MKDTSAASPFAVATTCLLGGAVTGALVGSGVEWAVSSVKMLPRMAQASIIPASVLIAAFAMAKGWKQAGNYPRFTCVGAVGGYVVKTSQLGAYTPLISAIF